MADLAFRLVVKDDGTAVVENFDEAIDDTVSTTKKAGRAMSKSLKGLGRTINSLPGLVFNLRNALIGIGGGLVIKSIIDTGRAVQRAQVRLIGLKGGVDAANEAFANFERIASGVAFSLDDVVEAGVAVEAFGAKSEEVLESVVDLAAFMGTSLPEAASAFGRAFAGGAGAADVLRERGVLTMVQLRENITDLSKLTLPEFRKALLEAMRDPTGPIADSAKLLAETVEGQLSFIGDAVFKLKKRFFEAGIGSVFSQLATNITIALNVVLELLEKVDFSELGTSIKDLIPSARAMIDVLFTVGKIVLGLVFAFQKAREVGIATTVGIIQAFGRVRDFLFEVQKGFVAGVDILQKIAGEAIAAILTRVSIAILKLAQTVAKLPLKQAQDFADSLTDASISAIQGAKAARDFGESANRLAQVTAEQKSAQIATTAAVTAGTIALNAARASTESTARAFSALVDGERVAAEAVTRLTAEADAQKEALDRLKQAKAENAAASKDLAASEVESVLALGTALESFQMGFNARSAEALATFLLNEKTRIAAIEDTAKRAKAAREFESKAAIQIAGATAGTILKTVEQFGLLGLNSRKAVAIAEAVVNTAVGITRAFAELGPFGGPVAALIAATGAAQIAAIAAARPGTANAPSVGGAVAGGAEGGGGAGPDIPRAEEGEPAAAAQTVNVTLSGPSLVGDKAEVVSEIAEAVREALGDGVEFAPR